MRAIPAIADSDEAPTGVVVSFAAARIERAADRMLVSAASIRKDAERLAALADKIGDQLDLAAAGTARIERSHQLLLIERDRARQIAREADEISALIEAGDLEALERQRDRMVAGGPLRTPPIG